MDVIYSTSPKLCRRGRSGDVGAAEFVGSRSIDGGSIGENWPLHRRIISKLRHSLLGLWRSTDPMSGFFCTSKKVFQRGESSINATGFKIGLEMMVRCRVASVKDVGISFKEKVRVRANCPQSRTCGICSSFFLSTWLTTRNSSLLSSSLWYGRGLHSHKICLLSN